jgi:hypothetical protein
MEPITSEDIRAFLQHLSERFAGNAAFYLLGGSALCLLGSPRETRDIDYMVELASGTLEEFEAVTAQLANEMHLDLEQVPLAEFIPLPPNANDRRRSISRFGHLEVYIFDLYSIALSKIARGFEPDLEDVMFLLHEKLIKFNALEQHAHTILPNLAQADIDQNDFLSYLAEIRRRTKSQTAFP